MVILAFFVLIASWFACGFYCSQVAYSKGYNGTAWAFGGFLFGFIALIDKLIFFVLVNHVVITH